MVTDRSRSDDRSRSSDAAAPRRTDRIPPLFRYVLTVVVVGPIVAVVMWLIDREQPVLETLFDGMFAATWLAAALIIGQEHGPGATRERDPGTEALRQAVRKQTVPDDARLRAALAARLTWLRKGAVRALVGGVPLFAALALVGLVGPVDSVWAVIFGVVLVVFVAVVVWNLSRVRRLSSRLATSTAGGVA